MAYILDSIHEEARNYVLQQIKAREKALNHFHKYKNKLGE